ncbi:E3 ubiquitin- ligase TRIM39-like protein [Labeo rohita]|uniref:E3 ubiquitin-ligase TRIM39-like protein n=1 Tax=Labeo rohita TaxID=84645 RepID=A0A498M1N7_LABRO|nr:E3 ubiquitin- ligase TRIM39-like protein [Labeo rohita]
MQSGWESWFYQGKCQKSKLLCSAEVEVAFNRETLENQLVQTHTDVQQMIQNRMKKIKEIQHSVEERKMFSSLCSRPHAKNWTEISVDSDVNVLPMNRALRQFKKTLAETLDEKLNEFELKLVQKFAVVKRKAGKSEKGSKSKAFRKSQEAVKEDTDEASEDSSAEDSSVLGYGEAEILESVGHVNQLVQTHTDVQQMIQNRMKKIQEIQHSVQMRKMYSSLYSRPHAKNWTEISIDSDVNVLPMNRALLKFKKTLHETLDEKLSLNQLIQTQTDVQQMIQNRTKKIQEIQHSVEMRKMFSCLYSRPHAKNWTEISVDSDVDVLPMNRALRQFKKTLDETLDEKLNQSELKSGEGDLSPEDGYWSVILRNENEYDACESSLVSLSLKVKPEIVGVFVDYEEGLVSFYDVGHRSHIYSFTGQTFIDKLYPYFSPDLKYEDLDLENDSEITDIDITQLSQSPLPYKKRKAGPVQHKKIHAVKRAVSYPEPPPKYKYTKPQPVEGQRKQYEDSAHSSQGKPKGGQVVCPQHLDETCPTPDLFATTLSCMSVDVQITPRSTNLPTFMPSAVPKLDFKKSTSFQYPRRT